MILPLPRTGPSSRRRLQFTTKIRLSSRSRAASVMEPSDSGSSISPSASNAQTLPPVDAFLSRGGPDHHRQRVPAHQTFDPALHLLAARKRRLLVWRNCILIGRGGGEWQVNAAGATRMQG